MYSNFNISSCKLEKHLQRLEMIFKNSSFFFHFKGWGGRLRRLSLLSGLCSLLGRDSRFVLKLPIGQFVTGHHGAIRHDWPQLLRHRRLQVIYREKPGLSPADGGMEQRGGPASYK